MNENIIDHLPQYRVGDTVFLAAPAVYQATSEIIEYDIWSGEVLQVNSDRYSSAQLLVINWREDESQLDNDQTNADVYPTEAEARRQLQA